LKCAVLWAQPLIWADGSVQFPSSVFYYVPTYSSPGYLSSFFFSSARHPASQLIFDAQAGFSGGIIFLKDSSGLTLTFFLLHNFRFQHAVSCFCVPYSRWGNLFFFFRSSTAFPRAISRRVSAPQKQIRSDHAALFEKWGKAPPRCVPPPGGSQGVYGRPRPFFCAAIPSSNFLAQGFGKANLPFYWAFKHSPEKRIGFGRGPLFAHRLFFSPPRHQGPFFFRCGFHFLQPVFPDRSFLFRKAFPVRSCTWLLVLSLSGSLSRPVDLVRF